MNTGDSACTRFLSPCANLTLGTVPFVRWIIFCMLCAITTLAFGQSEALQTNTGRFVDVGPDKNNQKVINRYNSSHFRADMLPYEINVKGAKDFTALFGIRSNSVMSTDDIEITILKKWVSSPVYDDKEDRVYFVQIRNKTDQPIFVDRSCCFRIDSDGSRLCYFDPNKNSDSLSVKRMIVIPPHGQSNLTDCRWKFHKKENYAEILEYPEDFLWNLNAVGITEGYLGYGQIKRFTEENSPYYRSFIIAYSKQDDFSTYSFAKINFYIREMAGLYFPETYSFRNIWELRLTGNNDDSITSWISLY